MNDYEMINDLNTLIKQAESLDHLIDSLKQQQEKFADKTGIIPKFFNLTEMIDQNIKQLIKAYDIQVNTIKYMQQLITDMEPLTPPQIPFFDL